MIKRPLPTHPGINDGSGEPIFALLKTPPNVFERGGRNSLRIRIISLQDIQHGRDRSPAERDIRYRADQAVGRKVLQRKCVELGYPKSDVVPVHLEREPFEVTLPTDLIEGADCRREACNANLRGLQCVLLYDSARAPLRRSSAPTIGGRNAQRHDYRDPGRRSRCPIRRAFAAEHFLRPRSDRQPRLGRYYRDGRQHACAAAHLNQSFNLTSHEVHAATAEAA